MADRVNTNQFDLKDIIAEIWNSKWLYIIVIVLALAVWFLYVKFVSETYSVSSTILIKTKMDNTRRDPYELMNVYDILGRDIVMQNELNRINSTPLIKEVLAELGQHVTYYIQQEKLPKELKFSIVNIYKQAPFMVILNVDHAQPLNTLFYVNILNDEEFSIECKGEDIRLYNFQTENSLFEVENLEFSGRFKFGENIQTEHFSFKLLLNSNYNPAEFLNKDMIFKFNNLNSLARSSQKALTITNSALEGSIAHIQFIGNNIQFSIDFVDQLIVKYIEQNLQQKTRLATTTLQYIDRQLANISDTLNRAEQQLQNFRRVHNIMDVDEKSQRILNQRKELEDDRDEISRRLNLLQQMSAYFNAAKEDNTTMVVPSFLGI